MAQDQIKHPELVVIGGSSGSLEVVLRILRVLPEHFPIPILLVIHRGSAQESLLQEVLSLKSNMAVQEVEEKEEIRPSIVYVSPADFHVLIEKDRTFSLDYSEKISYSRPSIDVSFISAAEVFKERLIGILLSGANNDGTEGMLEIKKQGGYCVIQKPEDSAVDYMPAHALKQVQPDAVLSGPAIADFLYHLTAH